MRASSGRRDLRGLSSRLRKVLSAFLSRLRGRIAFADLSPHDALFVPTGRERSLRELTAPDSRNANLIGFTPEGLQAPFVRALDELPPAVPQGIRSRLAVAYDLATYGWFRYEFYVVSLFWSISTVEMALREKFLATLTKPIILQRKEETKAWPGGFFDALADELASGWRLNERPAVTTGSLASLLRWARDEKLLAEETPVVLQEVLGSFQSRRLKKAVRDRVRPEPARTSLEILVEGLLDLRNALAHPQSFEWVLPPNSAQDAFRQAVVVVKQLWRPPSAAGSREASETPGPAQRCVR